MPGRDLMVRIRADITDFQNKMRMAKGQVASFDKSVQSGTSKSGKALSALGLSYRGVGFLAAAGAGAAVKSYADFDKQMSSVEAALGRNVTSLGQLRKAAIDAGNDTAFTAQEAAAGIENLTKAGVTAADILGGGLAASLDLAAAEQIEVAQAAEITATTLSQFSLRGKDATDVADRLAGTAYSVQGSVVDMAEALKYVGPVAANAGESVDSVSTAIGLLAKNGILGSQAGTTIRSMMARLQAPTAGAAEALDVLNVKLYEGGKFIGFAASMERLRKALAGMNEEQRNGALKKLFEQTDLTAAQIFLDEGAQGFRDMNKEIENQATVAEIASTKMDNLAGDWEKLKGTFDTVLISGGSKGNSPLRGLVQDLDVALKGVSDLNREWKKLTDKITGGAPGKNAIGGDEPGFFGAAKEFRQAIQIGRKTGVKAETVIKFKTEGAAGAQRDALKVARAANLTPKQVRSVLRLMGWSTKGIDPVIKRMQSIERKAFVARLKLLNPALTDKQIAGIMAKLDAAGKKNPKPKVAVDDKATPTLTAIQRELLGIKSKEITVTTHYETTGKPPGPWMGGRVGAWAGQMGFAGGGRVPGVGPSDGSDNVFARDQYGRGLAVRSREWIINEKASDLNDRYLRAINAGADFNKILPRFAGGGRIGGDFGTSESAGGVRILSGSVTINGLDGHLQLKVQEAMAGESFHAASRARAGGR